MHSFRRWCRQGMGGVAALVLPAFLLAAPNRAGPVSERPPKNGSGDTIRAARSPTAPLPVIALDVGLAGPPIVARDGSWWALGRDGQLVHLAVSDAIEWAIGVGAAVTGEAAPGDNGLLFVPTANDLIVAVQPGGTARWRSRTTRGVEGPLAWVPGQGLVFVGRDQNLCWLAPNAALLQTQRLVSRRSAGPVAFGTGFAIGTETGDVLVWTSRNAPLRSRLTQPIRAILGASASELLVLAGNDAYRVTTRGQVRWHRVGAVSLASVAEEGTASTMSVVVTEAGRVEWVDGRGEVAASMDGCRSSDESVPELVATRECAWISTVSGTLLQCCVRSGVTQVQLGRMPLQRPVLDTLHHRVLVASSQREVWSVPLPGNPGPG